MDNLAYLCLMLALSLCLYMAFAAVVAARDSRRPLLASARASMYATFALVSVAMVCLWYFLATSRFEMAYVAAETNRDLPMFYKLAALWAGQEGSLLLWTWLLALFSSLALRLGQRRHPSLMPYVAGVLAITTAFFLVLNLFVANPFKLLVEVMPDGHTHPFAPADGRGLNPLLQHPEMVIHPPILFLGYVGFAIPFAFAFAALATRQLGSEWIQSIRRWTLVPWLFLGGGILLGANWAYVELGWGGYWAWDPVENASIIPWFTATAFLHSIIVQERRGMLKVWNFVLAFLTHLLCLFGTFVTRSGVISSVHAFAKSSIGTFFLVFIGISGLCAFGLLVVRLRDLRSTNRVESLLSRESAFIFNNLVLLLACLAVLAGTVFPALSELFTGKQIAVGPPFFNKIIIPLGLLLMLLMGAAPLLIWQETRGRRLQRNFLLPLLGSIGSVGVAVLLGVRSVYPVLSFGLSGFVTVAILERFYRGVLARRAAHGESSGQAILGLFRHHQRRYGGLVVHFGIVLMVIGITGSAFNTEVQGTVGPQQSLSLGPYTFRCSEITQDDSSNPNYAFARAKIDILRGQELIATAEPEKRLYHASEQATSEVGIYSTLQEDLYFVLAGIEGNGQATVQIYRNPLIAWLWIGGLVMALGSLICVVPPWRKQEAPVRETSSARANSLQPSMEMDR